MEAIRTKVSLEGLLIPKEWLEGINEVEIQKQGDIILVVPIKSEDPVFEIGKYPVSADVTDGSVNLDQYIYGV